MDTSNISPHEDGAGEKLVDEKNGHNSKGAEIKYANSTSQNGEAKIDMENVKPTFAGMGKEELMKFANDPFWVRTRWFLFITFWVLWLAMFAGAIAIIALAPKCAPSTPKSWWQQSPVYKVDINTYTGKDKEQIKDLTSKLPYLDKIGIKTLVLSNILKVSNVNSDGIDEFTTIDPVVGSIEDYQKLISTAEKSDIKVLLTMVPNHSSLNSTMFNKSVARDPLYESFYVWAPHSGYNQDGEPVPPNNWLSKNGGTAWQWNDKRKEFYLHQFDKTEPELNYHNPEVVKWFGEIMQVWFSRGTKGIYLERTPYLLEDKRLNNESIARPPKMDFTDYTFWSHTQTKNLPELASVLGGWKKVAANMSGVLLIDEASLKTNTSVDLNLQPQTLVLNASRSAEPLKTLVNNTLASNYWPAWQINIEGEVVGSRLSKAMLLTSLLLPGVPVTIGGQEFGSLNVSTVSDFPIELKDYETKEEEKRPTNLVTCYKRIVKERSSLSVLQGTIDYQVLNNTVFAYTRIKSGNPGYLVAVNIGSSPVAVDLRALHSVPNELTLLASNDYAAEVDKKSEAVVLLNPGTVNVFNFVPTAKE